MLETRKKNKIKGPNIPFACFSKQSNATEVIVQKKEVPQTNNEKNQIN